VSAKKLVVSTYLHYILLALGALLLFVFVRQLSGVLLTFLFAGVLAYTLNQVVGRLEGWRVPRVVAVAAVFAALVVAVLAALLVVIVPGVGQVQSLVQNPEVLTNGATGLLDQARGLPYIGEQIGAVDQAALTRLVQSNAPSPGQVLSVTLGFISAIFGVFGVLLNLLLMLLISVYLLIDRERVSAAALNVLSATIRDQTVELFHAVESTLIKYLRGQLLLCAIMGVIGWAIAYFTFGRYSLLIGLWVGAVEIISAIGAFLVAVPAVAIALFSGGFTQALAVAALFLLAQQLEGNILVPKIQGGAVGVHPLWVLFATLAATTLYGIIGAIFAVSIVAIIAATLRYLRGTLLFERWRKPLLVMVTSDKAEPGEDLAVPAEGPTTGEEASVRGFVGRKR
jgi:predicted PurR-regulated permease PerM